MPGPLNITLDIEGLELLSEALLSMPDRVADVAADAGQQAIGVLQPSIEAVTNVDTGFLVSNTALSMEGPFTLLYANATPYASFVEQRFQFVERGVGNVAGEVDAIFEAAFDRLAGAFNGI